MPRNNEKEKAFYGRLELARYHIGLTTDPEYPSAQAAYVEACEALLALPGDADEFTRARAAAGWDRANARVNALMEKHAPPGLYPLQGG